MIFHRARELRDNNLIFCGPLAGPADRHRLSLARCPGLNRTSEVSAMTTLQRTAIVVGVGSAQGSAPRWLGGSPLQVIGHRFRTHPLGIHVAHVAIDAAVAAVQGTLLTNVAAVNETGEEHGTAK